MATVACGVCRTVVDVSATSYDKFGNMVCRGCAARSDIAEGEQRAASSQMASAAGVLVVGIICWFADPFHVISIATIIAGIGWMVAVARSPAQRNQLGGALVPMFVFAAAGTALAVLKLYPFILAQLR